MRHFIPLQSDQFKRLNDGSKQFELIKEDRPYRTNDTLIYQEISGGQKNDLEYTGKEEEFTIIEVMNIAPGLKSGYCILGIKPKEN